MICSVENPISFLTHQCTYLMIFSGGMLGYGGSDSIGRREIQVASCIQSATLVGSEKTCNKVYSLRKNQRLDGDIFNRILKVSHGGEGKTDIGLGKFWVRGKLRNRTWKFCG